MTPKETSEFFSHISNNSKQNAKKILLEYKEARSKSDWTRGYLDALMGMINSIGSSGTHLPFLLRVGDSNGKELRSIRREFEERIEKPFTRDYDRGFFTAWVQYISVLILYQ